MEHSPRNRPIGSLQEIEAWLTPFGHETRERLAAVLASDEAGFVFPPLSLTEFMWDARASLGVLAGDLRQRLRIVPAGRPVVMLIEAGVSGQGGLERRDAVAVFTPWMKVEALEEAELADGSRRIALFGRSRFEAIGVGFSLPEENALDPLVAKDILKSIADSDLPGGFVFVNRKKARLLRRALACDSALRHWFRDQRRFAAILDVPMSAAGMIPSDLPTEIETVRRLLRRTVPLVGVRFDRPVTPELSVAATEAMRDGGIAAGFSFRSNDRRRGPNAPVRLLSSYLRSGCYLPLSFDRRTPAALFDPTAPIEIITREGEWIESSDDWLVFWSRRLDSQLERLSRVLEYKRVERFMAMSAMHPVLSRWYHEFVVFNWPESEPAIRATFVDLGEVSSRAALTVKLSAASTFAARCEPQVALLAPEPFLSAARDEAAARCQTSTSQSVADQVAAHQYLGHAGSADPNSPLAPNLVDFVGFLPPKLGRVLEVGAGHGQLARALSNRAEGYVCVELSHVPLRKLDAARGEVGVVADLHRLPFASGSFDSIIANNVLEHVYDPIAALRGLAEVLRPGGRLFALVPLDALCSDYNLPAHLWKVDEVALGTALGLSGFGYVRGEVVDENMIGMNEAYPSCEGLCLKLEAERH